jgi:hypothetical protein
MAQQWVAAVSRRVDRALTCVNNGTYGFDCTESELRLSLPVFQRAFSLSLGGFEIKSLVFSPATQRLTEVDLLERPLAQALR